MLGAWRSSKSHTLRELGIGIDRRLDPTRRQALEWGPLFGNLARLAEVAPPDQGPQSELGDSKPISLAGTVRLSAIE